MKHRNRHAERDLEHDATSLCENGETCVDISQMAYRHPDNTR